MCCEYFLSIMSHKTLRYQYKFDHLKSKGKFYVCGRVDKIYHNNYMYNCAFVVHVYNVFSF